MLDCLYDGLIDTLKVIPYLLVTFLILEYLEHKMTDKSHELLSKNKKFGPLVGSILGALPQCGFSSMAANLFSARVITIGTVIAVFLSTSDEMLPIMISERANITFILALLGFKVLIGIIIGFLVDIVIPKKNNKENITDLCEHDHCNCEHESIIKSSIIHTLKIGLFILIANILINLIIFYIGEEKLSGLLLQHNYLTYLASSLVGLIPNCAASVVITELYLSKLISLGALLSGLLTGSGLGILLLFKTNKNLKENLLVITIIYFVGVIVGIIIDLVV